MAEVTNEPLYEILKKVQADVAHIKGRIDAMTSTSSRSASKYTTSTARSILRQDRHAVAFLHRLESH